MMMSVGYTAGARGVEGLFGNKEGFKKVIGNSKWGIAGGKGG